MTTNDGGPAFPVECCYNHEGKIVGLQTGVASGWETGMTLRDYFAAKAIPHTLARERSLIDRYGDKNMQDHVPAAAREAYRIADAMLAARCPQVNEDAK
jgi:hypothetical protein